MYGVRRFRSTANTSESRKSVKIGTPSWITGSVENEKRIGAGPTGLKAGPGLNVLNGSCPAKKSCENASLYRPQPARTTVLLFPLRSHAKPKRGEKLFQSRS